MLPLPPIRNLETPSPVREAIRKVDEYTLWAFNPQPHLVRGYREPAERHDDAG